MGTGVLTFREREREREVFPIKTSKDQIPPPSTKKKKKCNEK